MVVDVAQRRVVVWRSLLFDFQAGVLVSGLLSRVLAEGCLYSVGALLLLLLLF